MEKSFILKSVKLKLPPAECIAACLLCVSLLIILSLFRMTDHFVTAGWILPAIEGIGVIRVAFVSLAAIGIATFFASTFALSIIRKTRWMRMMLILASPLIGFILMELASNFELKNLLLPYNLYDIAILALVFLPVFFVGQRTRASILVFWFACLITGLAMSFVQVVKGEVITPADLAAIGTAVDVSSSYRYVLAPGAVLSLVLFAFSCCLLSLIKPVQIEKKNIKTNLCVASVPVLVSGLLFGNLSIKETLGFNTDWYTPTNSYQEQGTALAFLSLCQDYMLKAPDNYSKEATTRLLEPYSSESWDGTEDISVVVVMNEAFADLSVFPNLGETALRPELFWSVADDAIESGFAYSSVSGGGTSKSEFEMLTGASMANVNGGVYPYQAYDLSSAASLPKYFSSHGYETVAIHPMVATNWNRDISYKQLGFDEFIDERGFPDDVERLRGYPTDRSTYEAVLDRLKSSGRPQFIFDLTVQNHGGYTTGQIPEEMQLNVSLSKGQEMKEINEYASLLRQSDIQFMEFAQELDDLPRPVILCVFGDHQPGGNEKLYELATGMTFDEHDITKFENRFFVPYMIWANGAAKEQIGMGDSSLTGSSLLDERSDESDAGAPMLDGRKITSLNYLGTQLLAAAGLPLRDYDQYLLDLQDAVPAINAYGYMDPDGKWHSLLESEVDEEYSSVLGDYAALQYYMLFEDK